MKAKLKSRKLIIAVLASALLALSDQFGIDHSTGAYIAGVVATYLVSQGAHDVALARKATT